MSEQISVKWLAAIAKRQQQSPQLFAKEQSLRLIHREAPPLRIDKLGEVAVMGWWANQRPTPAVNDALILLMSQLAMDCWYLQWRPNRSVGEPQIILESTNPVPEQWSFNEGELRFCAQKDGGDNVGLFLDQRENRQWLKNCALGKKVLNLFSYTCGFSLAAAVGGAAEVVSVDLSHRYLEWGRRNFLANQLDPHRYGWRKMDSMEYLALAGKKNLQFDIIICDPPTFSRNGRKVFKIERELTALAQQCLAVLAPGGCVLFATNCEKLTKNEVAAGLKAAGGRLLEWRESTIDFDYGSEEPLMKSFVVRQ